MSGDLKLSYSDHAAARMLDRGIFKKQVRRTLRRPHRTYPQGSYTIAEYTTTSQVIIRVVYQVVSSEEAPVVVSAVRLGKLNGAFQRSEPGTYLNQGFDTAYIALLQGNLAETIQVKDGIFCDLNGYGEVMGVELFAYSRSEIVEASLEEILDDISLTLA